jgi:VWFA-related protein
MRLFCCTLMLSGLTLPVAILQAQTPPEPDSANIVIHSSVQEVVLDVVARHKNESLVPNLKASDFTVTENGVPQTIRSFRFVGGKEAGATGALPPQPGPAAAAPVPAVLTSRATSPMGREPNFISIVFDEMSAASRRNALEAATEFLNQEFQENTRAAIFRLNSRINVIHGFTTDRSALASAVRVAVNGTPPELAAASANVLNETDYTLTGSQGGVSLNPEIDVTRTPDFSTSGASSNPVSESQAQLAALITNQRGMVDSISGMRAWESLQQIIHYEAALPGRKTVLYLSDGLAEPPGRPDVVREVVSAANRANVTFYCIDVRGLMLSTANGAGAGLTNSAAAESSTQGTMSSSPSAAMEQARQFDLLDQASTANLQLNMTELAKGTGGFAVFSTNEFKKNVARIMEEVRTHYEITYVPKSKVFDGKFRKIEVKVDEPHVTVHTREGYFALPELNGEALQPFEATALHILEAGPRKDFAFRAAALRFKPVGNGYHFEMSFNVPLAGLTTGVDQKRKRARLHVEFLALLRDSSGQVVAKVSREIDREIPAANLAQFRRGDVIANMPFEAAQGDYTIDAEALDPEGNRASIKRMVLEVPPPGGHDLSSLVVVRSLEKVDQPRNPGNPLEFAGGKVTPAIDQSASASAGVLLFFVVYPDRGASGAPRVTVQFFHHGKPVGNSQPEVGSPDELNTIPMLQFARLPAGDDYVARVVVQQGKRTSSESAPFSVAP